MANVIDELISKFSLDTKGYEEGGKKVLDITHKAGEAFGKANEKAKELGKTISEKFKFGELLGPLAALGTAVGLVELGKDAVETARKFDVLERKLAGLTGSYARAKEIMKFGEEQAGLTGLFNPEQLDQASIELEAFGLNAEKYLPIVQALGAVFGSSGEGLDTFAQAIGRIAEGDPGRAMAILARAGIGRKELQAKGVTFNGRQPTSSPEKIIQAIELVVTEKYGGVLGEMIKSPDAVFGRLKVAWERFLISIGTAIETKVLPFVDSLSTSMTKIVESGQLDRIVNGFLSLFGVDGSQLGDVFQKIADALEGLPGKIKGLEDKFRGFFATLWENLPKLIGLMAALWATSTILEFANLAVQAYATITKAIGAAAAAQATLDAMTGVGIAIVLGALAVGGIVYAGVQALADQVSNSWNDSGKGGGAPSPGDVLKALAQKAAEDAAKKKADELRNGVGGVQDAQTYYLSQIASNTKQSATDLRKFAFGGGDLLRQGVTPIEMAGHMGGHGGIRSRASRRAGVSNSAVVALSNAIQQYVDEQLSHQMGGYMRHGMVQSQRV